MTELLDDIDAPSDAELISRVRGGDIDAYGDLFARHVDAARRLSRQLTRGGDADDLVSEAFTKVMGVLRNGGGPDVAFRAYLLTAVRRLHVDRVRAQSRLTPSDDMELFDPGLPFRDTAVEQFESGAAAKAFASLPERWQLVLWHLEVENQKPAEIAPLLGMSANSVAALAYRAREGLRQAFLSAHLADTVDTDCRWVTEHLGGFVRKGLSKRDSAKVQTHLDGCRRCTAMYLELDEVNSNLRGLIGPLLLGSLAAGYAAGSGAGAGVAAGGVVALFGRAREFAVANLTPVVAGTAAASVAIVTAVAITVGGGDSPGTAPRTPATSTIEGSSPSDGSGTSDGADGSALGPEQQELLQRIALPPAPGVAPAPSVEPTEPGGEQSGDLPGADPGQLPGADPAEQPGGEPGGAPEEQPSGGEPDGDRPDDGEPSEPSDPDPPTDPPPGPPPGPPTADVSVSSAQIVDNSVRVGVDGLPNDRVTILVNLSSRSGQTMFALQDGACQVTAANRQQARCETAPGPRRSTSVRAERGFQAPLPLAFPDDLRIDRLSVVVGLAGYRDPDPGDNGRSVDFTPPRPQPPVDPPSPVTPQPSSARDITLTLGGNVLGAGIGRFRAQVHGLDGRGGSRTPLHFQVWFGDNRVELERLPHACRHLGDRPRSVACIGHGSSYTGIFDADLRRLPKHHKVAVEVTVTLPGVTDPAPADNTRWIELKRPRLPFVHVGGLR